MLDLYDFFSFASYIFQLLNIITETVGSFSHTDWHRGLYSMIKIWPISNALAECKSVQLTYLFLIVL